ncbi:MAG: hypothetical protein ARM1_0803 [Candidatus Micrarchaeota archaeon]|nr:MAG: hypothetical protein ARM1_0803 [Candidatus Micrarchaeota archaeon]
MKSEKDKSYIIFKYISIKPLVIASYILAIIAIVLAVLLVNYIYRYGSSYISYVSIDIKPLNCSICINNLCNISSSSIINITTNSTGYAYIYMKDNYSLYIQNSTLISLELSNYCKSSSYRYIYRFNGSKRSYNAFIAHI